MKDDIIFSPNDIIYSKNGAEHICNWFLDTKSGLITSMKVSDFTSFNRVLLLIPNEGRVLDDEQLARRADNETDRYTFMMSNIVVPENAELEFESPYFRLYVIQDPPAEWLFDADGLWLGYQ